MKTLKEALNGHRRLVKEPEYEEKAEEHRGYDTLEFNEDGSMATWYPQEHCEYTPKPRLLKKELEKGGYDTGLWDTWFHKIKPGQEDIIIFGAGASTLKQPLELLDNKIVYGVNWTMKWFNPTFLQIIDDQPLETQVKESRLWKEQGENVQLVTSLQCRKKNMGNYKKVLDFRIRQSSNPQNMCDFAFAEEPTEIMTWYANSLGYALNTAYLFRPKRIILMGFDFGGAHFFGDGRCEGAMCHYGMEGNMKKRLMTDLEQLYAELVERGQEVIQVGESKLEVFPKVARLDEVLS